MVHGDNVALAPRPRTPVPPARRRRRGAAPRPGRSENPSSHEGASGLRVDKLVYRFAAEKVLEAHCALIIEIFDLQ